MKTLPLRLACSVLALIGAVLVGALAFGIPAGASSPAADGARSITAARAASVASLSDLERLKSGKLTPRLQRLSQPALLKASAVTQAAAAGLPNSGPGSLLRAADGKLIAYVRVSGPVAGASAAIENAGAKVVNTSKRYGVLTVAVSPGRLEALGKLSLVASVQEALAPMYSVSDCPSGAVVSEGDSQLQADTARSTDSVDGAGVTVGILSDSYDISQSPTDAATGVAAGELPGTGNTCAGQTTPVNVLQDDFTFSGADEGRAMLENVKSS